LTLAFADDRQISAVELLSARISELEEAITEVEAENEELLDGLLQRQSEVMGEEVLYDAPPRPAPRRSTRNLSEDFEADPDNSVLMEDGAPRRQDYITPAMARYAEVLARTTRNVDVHTPTENLVETWKLQN
jgi:hypothetical protein